MKYIAIDFETAYWGPGNACSLGIVASDGEKITDEWFHLIRPVSMEFNASCVEINGIHPEDVAEEKTFADLWDEIRPRLEGNLIFAHNARFDMNVLASAMACYDLPDMDCRYGDTVSLSRVLWPDLLNHKLNTVAEALGFDFNHHQALDDARACEYIVRKGMEKIAAPTPEFLLQQCAQPLRPLLIDRERKKLIYQ